jgi:hypothetical protein
MRGWILTAGVGLAGAMLAVPAARAEGPAISWGQPRDGFQIGMYFATGKKAYKSGERFAVQLQLKNVSEKPVTLSLQRTSQWLATLMEGGKLSLQPMTQGTAEISLQPGEAKEVPGDTGTFVVEPWDGAGASAEPMMRLAPGKYHLECSSALWVPDKDDASRATGLRAHPGALDLEILPDGQAAAPKIDSEKARKGENAVWGKPVQGLQLGLRFKEAGTKFKAGDSVTGELLVRNVSSVPLQCGMLQFKGGWDGNTPAVTDEKGDYQSVEAVFFTGIRPYAELTLKPEESVVLGSPNFTIRPAGDKSAPTVTPTAALAPGKYHFCIYESARPNGATWFTLLLQSGQLDFEVTPS